MKRLNGKYFAGAFAVSLMIAGSWANAKALSPIDQETVRFLKAFHQNPRKAADIRLPKRDADGKPIDHVESLFPQQDIKNGKFVEDRDEIRKNLCTLKDGFRFCLKDYKPGKAPFGDNDRVEDLVELPHIMRSLSEMEKGGLLKTRLTKLPWSDSYWPLNRGLVAIRYADAGFPNSNDFMANYKYFLSRPPSAYGGSASLSPAEKYDYLVGDSSYTLAHANWQRGKDLYDSYKTVEGWDGICDGWSAASIMYDEPVKTIQVTASNGSRVTFFPSDIKGLGSLLWATGNNPTRFLGGRCKVRSPVRDEVGRTIAQECFDTNPGTFHMAIVNQLGQAHRPMIMDATYDYEIWNYPVWMYEYSYFNPQTLQPTTHWRDALVSVDDFTIDKFKRYRSPKAAYVVGISMNVSYMVELQPSTYDGSHAAPRTAHYIYDLELDANKQIIGGEWYTTVQHPDFVWSPPVASRAMSVADPHLIDHPSWTGDNPVPMDWVEAAPIASSQAQPLAVVIEKLVQLSKQQ